MSKPITKVIESLEKIIEGCRNVKEETGIHSDAKSLATQVIRDCNLLIKTLEKQE